MRLVATLGFCLLAFSVDGEAPLGEPAFAEGFQSGLDRFEVLDPATWRVSDDTANGEANGDRAVEIVARESAHAPPHRSPLHVALVRDLRAGDCVIEFRVKSTKDTGNHRDCCVFFGWQDAAHFYYAHLGAKPDPASGQIMIVDGADRRPLTTNRRAVPWDNAWHTVRLERTVADGRITVYFDDLETPIMVAIDNTFGVGRVGIGSFDDQNAFSGLRVWAGAAGD